MNDPSWALQSAVYKVLNEAPSVAAAFGGEPVIYDRPPQNIPVTPPYITIGDDQIVGTTDGCHDGSEAFVTVHIWSQDASRRQAKQIAAAVASVLDTNLTLTGFYIVTHTLASIQHMQDRNRELFHSVVSLRFDVIPA